MNIDVQTPAREIRCQDCGSVFIFPADPGEGVWFRERGYPDPIRCADCRRNRHANHGRPIGPDGQVLSCIKCGEAFVVDDGEAAWLKAKFGPDAPAPKRCRSCRRARRTSDPAGGQRPIAVAEARAL